jgi:hypothetical protein
LLSASSDDSSLARIRKVRPTVGQLGSDLASLVSYDERLSEAARQLGYRVASPR